MRSLSLTLLAVLPRVWAQSTQIPLSDHATQSLSIPLLGYGTWNLKSNASEAVSYAIQTGYRHIDCAAIYGNEKEVGKGIADGLEKTGLSRSDIWVTSKLWNDHHRPDLVEKALDKTLSDLGLDYVDLYHMHWPVASDPATGKPSLDYIDTWRLMTTILTTTSKIRHIGVSNFSPSQLSHLLSSTPHKPFAHQMELHPYLQQPAWLQYHQARGIHVTAYSPFANANPTYNSPKKDDDVPPILFENDELKAIAKDAGCTPATVALSWGMGRGTSVIPKSAHPGRIEENFGSLGCELGYEALKRLEKVGVKYLTRFNNPSKSWGVDLYGGLDDS